MSLADLTRTRAQTDSRSPDPRLVGRTYAIPFDRVWSEALALAGGGLSRWRLLDADDERGLIRAEATSRVLRRVGDVQVRVSLDANAQTRVDLISVSRGGKGDLGANARRIGRFTRELDRRLAATRAQILDGSRQPVFTV